MEVLKWIRRSCLVLDPVTRSDGPVAAHLQEKEASVYTEHAPNNTSVVVVDLDGFIKMLYCTHVRGVTLLPPLVLMFTLWYLRTGKVKYISRAEFGFYANCWSVFPVIKSNKSKKKKGRWTCSDLLGFIVCVSHRVGLWTLWHTVKSPWNYNRNQLQWLIIYSLSSQYSKYLQMLTRQSYWNIFQRQQAANIHTIFHDN